MTVLILSDLEDEHASHVAQHLRDQQIDCRLLDSRWFPRDLSLWFDPKSGDGAFGFPEGDFVAFDKITAIYWRNYHGVAGPRLPDPEQSFIAENDSRSLFESVLLRLQTRWVNSFAAYRSHQTKGAQLAIVAQLGVQIPDTLLTNEPASVSDFIEYHPQAIFKPTQGGAHTRRVDRTILKPERLNHLMLAPITLQQAIEGTNIRVFLAGARIEACEIRTDHVDFRDDPDPRVAPHELPLAMTLQCQQIADALDLVWTGIDFRLTPDGTYVFLEANPSPMFLGFEEACGLPLTQMLCELLTQV